MISDEILALTPLILLIVGSIVIVYTIKKVTEAYKIRKTIALKQTGKKGLMANLPDSAYEMLCQLETGLDFQVQQIAEKCKKDGKNPMQDTGYMTVLNQYQSVKKWKERFESNPIFIMADQIGWPILKNILPDGLQAAKRLMKAI